MIGATATLGSLDADPPRDEEEEQPRRGEDYDLLAGWPRSLSVSPRLYPTLGQSSPSTSAIDNAAPTSALSHYRGLGDHSPLLLARNHGLTSGTGFSPILGPTHVSSASTSANAHASTSAFDYTSFGQYHLHHPMEPTATPAVKSEKQSSPFNPVRTSASPDLSKRRQSPKVVVGPVADLKPKLEEEALPTGMPEEACVQAYAKLEFPTFDIFIQKLSVIVGRRPASAAIALGQAANVAPVEPPVAETQAVKLEDFVNGLEDESTRRSSAPPSDSKPVIKEELPTVEITPSSQPGSPGADKKAETPDAKEEPTANAESKPGVAAVASGGAPAPAAPIVDPGPTVDVDLGPIRAVSRQHARLFFDYAIGGWVIEVLGRNGVVVDGKWTAKGEKERLSARTRIQIAERIFHFVLPDINPPGEADDALADDGLSLSDDDEDDDSVGFSSSLSELSEPDAVTPSHRPTKGARAGKGKGASALEVVRGKGKGKAKAAPAKGKAKKGKAPKSLKSIRRLSRTSRDDEPMEDVKPEHSDAESSRTAQSTSQSARKITIKPPKDPAAAASKAMPQKQPKKVREGAPPSIPSEAATLIDIDDSVIGSPSVAPDDMSVADDGPSDSASEDEGTVAEQETASTVSTPAPPANPYALPPPVPDPNAPPAAASQAATTPAASAGPSTSATTSASTSQPSATASAPAPVATVIGPDGQPIPVDPNKPIKRGRGRPPKNGIAAQRRKKPTVPTGPKIDPLLEASGSILAPGPPEDDNEPAQPQITYPPGEEPPLQAPETDKMLKPPYTYASLIAQAVQSSSTKKLTLHGIYDWITEKWPYFTDNQNGWQNSIRHNLTLSRGFLKIPRRAEEPGKGSFWAIDPPQLKNFDGRNFRKKNIKPSTPAASTATSTPVSTAAVTAAPKPRPAVPTSTPSTGTPTAASTSATAPRPPAATVPRPPGATAPTSGATAPPRPAAPNVNGRPPAPASGSTAPRPVTTGAPTTTAKPGAPAAAAKPAPGKPTKPPPNLSVPLPIVVGPIPDTYVRPPPPPTANGQPPDELTLALLKDPPIILHEGRLILNPTIFANLKSEQLSHLQTIPASQALQTLQAFVVQYFKDKMKREAAERERIRKEREAKGLPVKPAPGKPMTPGAPRPAGAPAPNGPRPAGAPAPKGTPVGKPGVATAPRPGAPANPNAPRPGAPANANAPRPGVPGTAVPRPATPGSAVPRLPGTAAPNTAPRPAGMPVNAGARPAAAPAKPGTPVARPGAPATTAPVRPGVASPATGAPRPVGTPQTGAPRPAGTPVPTIPRPAGVAAANAGTVPRPGQPAASRPAGAPPANAPRPPGTAAPTAPNAPRPATSAAPAPRPGVAPANAAAAVKPGTPVAPRPTVVGTASAQPRPAGAPAGTPVARPAGVPAGTPVARPPGSAVPGTASKPPNAATPARPATAATPGARPPTAPVTAPKVTTANAAPAKPAGTPVPRPAGAPHVATGQPAKPVTPSTTTPAAPRPPAPASTAPKAGSAAPPVRPAAQQGAPAPATTARPAPVPTAGNATANARPVAVPSSTAAKPATVPAPSNAVPAPKAATAVSAPRPVAAVATPKAVAPSAAPAAPPTLKRKADERASPAGKTEGPPAKKVATVPTAASAGASQDGKQNNGDSATKTETIVID